MSKLWRWFLPGYLLALPATLVGLLLCIYYRPTGWTFRQGVLTCQAPRERVIGRPGAQTWGWLIVYTMDKPSAGLRAHEYTHVVQGFIGGPLFLLAYGLCFAVQWPMMGFGDWRPAYEANPFERHAQRVQKAVKLTDWGV